MNNLHEALKAAVSAQNGDDEIQAMNEAWSVIQLHGPALLKLVEEHEALAAKLKTHVLVPREPVAFGLPNSSITPHHALMQVALDIPSNDQYGGALWVPLYAAITQENSDE